MKDEMARAKSRLELQIPKLDKPVRPYYIEYRYWTWIFAR